jgi:predicted negative regulator of RcsB-dependent stress response
MFPFIREESSMRTLVGVIVLLTVGVIAVGFYRGWFQVSSEREVQEQKVSTTFTVDEGKVQEDKEKLQGAVDRATAQPAETSGAPK